MKIYLASAWDNAPQVRKYMDQLEKMDHEITMDWTKDYFDADSNSLSERTTQQNVMAARQDFFGVVHCNVFIGIFEDDSKTRGAWTELGIALAKGKHIVMIGKEESMKNIFCWLPSKFKIYDTWEDMLEDKYALHQI